MFGLGFGDGIGVGFGFGDRWVFGLRFCVTLEIGICKSLHLCTWRSTEYQVCLLVNVF